MDNTATVLTAAAVLLAAVIVTVTLVQAFRYRHTVSKRLAILLAGICVSSFFLFLPRYWQESVMGEHSYPSLRSLTYTLYYSLKAISGGQQIDVMEEMEFHQNFPSLLRLIYYVMNYTFLVAAPVLTSSLVLSLVGDVADQMRCRLWRSRKYHIFSELNETALDMAEKIKAGHPKEKVVFCGTQKADKERIAKARAMGAALLYAPCKTAKLPLRGKLLQFYLVAQDEDINLNDTEALIEKYAQVPEANVVINAFAESGTGIQMVESMPKGNVGLRFVDGTALLCNELLMRFPLDQLPADRRTISVAIIGCDRAGMRMLKTMAWCGQVKDLGFKIRVYDKQATLLERILQAQCPELMANCDIAFCTADARSAELETAILDPNRGSPDATYIVTAMEDDDLNIAVAERIYKVMRHHNRYRWTPRILARIRSATKSDIYAGEENVYLTQRRISVFGDVESVFLENTLFHSYLENLSFAVDLCYNGLLPQKDPDLMTEAELKAFFGSKPVREARGRFLQSEYNRRSSMAAALHIPVKLRSCGILPADQRIPTAQMARQFSQALQEDPGLLDALAENEHQRWNQFMRSEGYVQADWNDLLCFYPLLEKKNNQDALSKRHLCLTTWEQLDALNEQYLALDPPVRKDFKKSDYDLVRSIPQILLLANRMEQIDPDD